jgi:hypothetical protein
LGEGVVEISFGFAAHNSSFLAGFLEDFGD